MSFPNHLYLLFLLLILFLALFSKAVREYVTRTAVGISALTVHELREQPRIPTMSDVENERWKALIRESEATIETYLIPAIDIDLASLIRCLTFRIFLVVFLGVDRDRFTFANVQLVTGALSDYYQEQRALSPEVESILYEWLPHQRFRSSLYHILPAYEVLWRIVATLVVTCEEEKSLRWVLMDFRDNPRDRQYRSCLGADGKSVAAITDAVVDRLKPITSLPSVSSNWPLSSIQNASWSGNATARQAPTVQEALKFAALLASMVVGLVGVHYGIFSDGGMGSDLSPWGQRKIVGMQNAPPAGHVAINVFPYAGTSNQAY